MFKNLAVALAFSPYSENLLNEAVKLSSLFDAKLSVIHIAESKEHDKAREKINDLLESQPKPAKDVDIIIESGAPARAILHVSRKLHIDLLICGALKKENILHYYIGSVSRTILRKTSCSVLVLLASGKKSEFKRITVDCNEERKIKNALNAAFLLGAKKNARQIHLVRELKLYGLTMAMEEYTEERYTDVKKGHIEKAIAEVQQMLSGVDTRNLKVNIKITGGKPGYELSRFIKASRSDLMISPAPDHKLGFLDRVFPHHLEYLFANLPCNVLLVH